MKEVKHHPRLWSDFDGTAVETVSKFSPRNWRKYPLAGIPGYEEFLQGVWASGIKVKGVVSRRPNRAQRERVTRRSIQDLDLGGLLGVEVVLTRSEAAKAKYVADQSAEGTVVIVDDKPHKVGPLLVSAVIDKAEQLTAERDIRQPLPNLRVVLAAVNHDEQDDRIDNLVSAVRSQAQVNFQTSGDMLSFTEPRLDRFRLDVVRLAPYSIETGLDLARNVFDA